MNRVIPADTRDILLFQAPRSEGCEAGGCGYWGSAEDTLSPFLPHSWCLSVGVQTSELWLVGADPGLLSWALGVLEVSLPCSALPHGRQTRGWVASWVHTGPRQCPERGQIPVPGSFSGPHPAPKPHLPLPGPLVPLPTTRWHQVL